MSTLREAAQAALEHWDKVSGIFRMTTETNRLRAALAKPETTAEPVAWLNRYHAAMVTQDRATANAMGFTTPLYAHPPRDEWRSAVHEELFTSCIYSAKHARDPRAAIRDIIDWNVRIALDPAVSSDAQALIDKGRAMGDEWRLASEVPKDSRPHAYLLKKLAMVMPLFQEARDALTAITEQQRRARGISPSLADRMDAAGTYSVDDWRDVQPPTEVAK